MSMAFSAPCMRSADRSKLLDPRTGEPVLGLEAGAVRLRDYTPLWAELYLLESTALRRVLGCLALDVQHVGSTAVPGLKAKPILDIAIAIPACTLFSECARPLGA